MHTHDLKPILRTIVQEGRAVVTIVANAIDPIAAQVCCWTPYTTCECGNYAKWICYASLCLQQDTWHTTTSNIFWSSLSKKLPLFGCPQLLIKMIKHPAFWEDGPMTKWWLKKLYYGIERLLRFLMSIGINPFLIAFQVSLFQWSVQVVSLAVTMTNLTKFWKVQLKIFKLQIGARACRKSTDSCSNTVAFITWRSFFSCVLTSCATIVAKTLLELQKHSLS